METAILARHGESDFSVRGLVNGDPSIECVLTEAGRKQAVRLAEELREEPIDLCVVTEFMRTQETADLALEGRNVPRLVLPELNDIRFGEFEGGLLDVYRAWGSANPPTAQTPGDGESRAETVLRYVHGYRALLERPEETILVVAHGLPIRYALNALAGQDPVPIVDQVPYASPQRFDAPELTQAVERLERWAANPAWPESRTG